MVRTVLQRRPGLLESAAGATHQEPLADDPAGVGRRHVLVAQVDAVGAGQDGDVGPVVHQHQGPAAPEHHHLPGGLEEGPGRGGLEADLHHRSAAVESRKGVRDRILVPDDGVQASQAREPPAAIEVLGERHGERLARA